MTFRVGMKVVCVDASGNVPMLNLGAIYTICGFTEDDPPGLQLVEVSPNEPGDNWYTGFRPRRFRPVVERKTDISVFIALLNPSPAKVLDTVMTDTLADIYLRTTKHMVQRGRGLPSSSHDGTDSGNGDGGHGPRINHSKRSYCDA